LPATVRAISSASGDAQRLNSSIVTRFGAACTTSCGRSTAAGIDTGPTATAYRASAAPPAVAVELSR
jgi:hypothetical protein